MGLQVGRAVELGAADVAAVRLVPCCGERGDGKGGHLVFEVRAGWRVGGCVDGGVDVMLVDYRWMGGCWYIYRWVDVIYTVYVIYMIYMMGKGVDGWMDIVACMMMIIKMASHRQ